jgi:hypothetical protein
MKKPLFLIALGISAFLLEPCANACGDKMMAIGRGVRFAHAYKSPYPASILIYLRPGSSVQQADNKILLQSTLVSVGHRVRTAQDRAQLEDALRLGNYDLVLTDSADAAELEPEVQVSRSKPLLLPVLYKPSKSEDSSARNRYPWVLKAPGNIGQLLATIDAAMDSKSRNAGRSVAEKM